MEFHNLTFICFTFLIFLISYPNTLTRGAQLPLIVEDQDANELKTYIVHVMKPEGTKFLGDEDLKSWHLSFLPQSALDSGEPRLVYSYRHAISGFAARLTPSEVGDMESMDGFVYAQPDKQLKPLTTYTHEFLGLSQWDGAWSKTLLGEGTIIGVLDTGITPTHPSFKDGQMPPRPLRWNGTCSPHVKCNNKIIGAWGFNNNATASPIDEDGHGTHVAGTAAGSPVSGASVLGAAKGTATGMAPRAHLAIYRVCFPVTLCMHSNTLAGIDQAISDGVDVISMSIGGDSTAKYYQDPIAIGSLAAMEKGITAVAAAGNSGPNPRTLQHDAPWVVVVGAATTDRRVVSVVKLDNGEEIEGESGYQPPSSEFDPKKMLPLVYPGKNGFESASYCLEGSLDHISVKGKIVLCNAGGIADVHKGKVVDAAGGAAMIVMNQPMQGYTTFSEAHVLPVAHLSSDNGWRVVDYFLSTSDPKAAISFNATQFGYKPAPTVAYFSSRGPSQMNGGILKPDVLAPGVNVLAAWPKAVGPKPSPFATKTFNFESGTSMATPHVSGIVALIKSVKPDWSPAFIQSAIVTSAIDQDLDGNNISDENSNGSASIFTTGAGQVNASAAMDPGLVYDVDTNDYIRYLCGLGYADWEVKLVARRQIKCSKVGSIGANQLNYPSIAVSLKYASTMSVERTVTNVGEENSDYSARITEPDGVRVDLSTYKLQFDRVGQQKSFTVKLTVKTPRSWQRVSSAGKIEWVSDKRVVKSPIAVSFD